MAIGTITAVDRVGEDGQDPTFVEHIKFAGDATYPDGGTLAIETAIRAALGTRQIELMAVIAEDCGVYLPQLVETPAEVTSAATFATADQDTNTLIYEIDGVAATLTLAGVHTSAAHLVASWNAVAGLYSYVDATGQVFVRTDDGGADKTFQITGGTANAVYLFPTTLNSGSAVKRLRVRDLSAAGADAQVGTGTTDLSGTVFNLVVLGK